MMTDPPADPSIWQALVVLGGPGLILGGLLALLKVRWLLGGDEDYPTAAKAGRWIAWASIVVGCLFLLSWLTGLYP